MPEIAAQGHCPACLLQFAMVDGGERKNAPNPTQTHPTPARPAQGSGSSASSELGDRIKCFGDYELLNEIARGGMGVVYRARQTSLQRTVAIKMILAGQPASDAEIRRFQTEAKAAANLDHPNIVPVFEVGAHEGRHYFSMGLIEGPNLARWLADRKAAGREKPKTRKEFHEIADLIIIVTEAIHYAHQRGILHRDIKPSNILLDGEGVPYVTDFGLAKHMESAGGETLTGTVMGTPGYMSPEQAEGRVRQLTTATDVYSLGAILYQLLTGRPPLLGKTPLLTIRKVIETEPKPPRSHNPEIDRDLDTICLKCLEKDPEKRYASAAALADDLERWRRREPIAARPSTSRERLVKWAKRRPAVAALSVATLTAILAGFGGVAWQWRRAEDSAGRERIQRQEAETQRRRAEEMAAEQIRQRKRAEATLTQLQFERAEDLFNDENPSEALAYLAAILRREPANRVAAARTLFALTQRSFPLPAAPPFTHDDLLLDAAFSPDGSRVITASRDKTARIWDWSGSEVKSLVLHHEGSVVKAVFSPDGDWVATASSDGSARVWDAASGNPLLPPWDHGKPVRAVAISPDGKRVATAAAATAWIRRAATGEIIARLDGHRENINHLAFSPDSSLLATASGDHTARIWSVKTGEAASPPIEHGNPVHFLQFSPDSRRIATSAEDATARISNSLNGRRLSAPMRHGRSFPTVWAARFDYTGKRLATSASDQTSRVWDANTGQPITGPLKHKGRVYDAQFDPQGRRVVTASNDQTARVWSASSGDPIGEPLKHSGRVVGATFSPDGRYVLTASYDGTGQLWDVHAGQARHHKLIHRDRVSHVAFSPNSKLLATSSHDDTAIVWNTDTGEAAAPPLRHLGNVVFSDFSADGDRLTTASHDGFARVWIFRSENPLATLMKHDEWLWSSKFNPAGTRIITSSRDGTARVWDAQSGQPVTPRLAHNSHVMHAEFDPDGRRVVTASWDSTAVLWNAETGEKQFELKHDATVDAAHFSERGDLVVTASADGSAAVWRADNGACVGRPLRHAGEVQSARFDRSGNRVVTAAKDGTARIWNARTGDPMIEPIRHEEAIRHAEFSPEGNRVVIAGGNRVRIWDAATGWPLTEWITHDDGLEYACFNADGTQLATASRDGTALLLDLPDIPAPAPAWLAQLAESVAGRRLNTPNVTEPQFHEELWRLRQKLLSQPHGDFYQTWAHWFFADRTQRPISPWARQTMPEFTRKGLQPHSSTHWIKAMSLSPTGPLANTFVAHQALIDCPVESDGSVAKTERHRILALKQLESERGPDFLTNLLEPGAGLRFNGRGDHLSADSIPFDEYAAFTIEVWVRNWNGQILGQGRDGDPENSLSMALRPTHKAAGWESGSGKNFDKRDLPGQILAQTHLALVYDGRRQRIFSNGQLIHRSAAIPPPGPFDRSREFLVAALQEKSGLSFASGLLLSVRISRNACYLENFEPPSQFTAEADTELLYDLSEPPGEQVMDLSGNGRHAKIHGAKWVRFGNK